MLIIGSRGSLLALWQAEWIKSRLSELGEECRIEIVKTTGDTIADFPLAKVGTKGMFTKEIEEALLAGSIDVAVHSLKDMPTDLPAGLTLAAIPVREDPRDAMAGRSLSRLPQGARVGTSSLRRSAQLRALRSDLQVDSIRGNVDTRLRKLNNGEFHAIVLAAAGLRRLGLDSQIAELLAPDRMCPAPGQGALAVETRQDGGRAEELSHMLDHASTRAAVSAERALLAAMGGGCQVPLGAFAEERDRGIIHLQAVVISPDGTQVVRGERLGAAASATALGESLGRELLERGGREILEAVYTPSPEP